MVENRGDWARVEVTRNMLCDHCNEKESCGVMLENGRQSWALVKNPLGARPGDLVELSIKDNVVLWGALTIYAIPLAGLLLFVFLALYLNSRLGGPLGRDTLAILAGGVGLILSFLLVRQVSRRWKFLAEGAPVISRIFTEQTGQERQ